MSEMYATDHLISNAEKYPNEPAMSWKESGQWVTMTWSQYLGYTMSIAKAMIAMGFEAGDHSAIFSYNRAEWYASSHAAMFCGGANAGVYHTSSSEEVEHVIGNSDAKVVFLGGNPMDGGVTEKKCSYRLSRVLPNLDKVEKVVVMDEIDMPDDHRVVSWSDFIASGSGVPDSTVHESKERVMAAIRNAGFEWPRRRDLPPWIVPSSVVRNWVIRKGSSWPESVIPRSRLSATCARRRS